MDFFYMKNQRVFFKYIDPNLIFLGENSFRTFAICFFFIWLRISETIFFRVKARKTRIYFWQAWKSSRYMGPIFCKLNKLKKHESNFLQASKSSKNMKIIFCELNKLENMTWIFFCYKAKKTCINVNFLQV